ncbi:ABC transporter permease [Streptomyces sp. NPDC090075]|uniref:ABC transporter permease n=1 Tax=Streptomyces sp. NPDC090075 TaxID=3365937 RepID=UPI0037F40874
MAGQLSTETGALPTVSAVAAPRGGRAWAVVARVGLVLLRRALLLAALLAVVFAGVELLPGDAASATSERGESAADLAARRHGLGLDRPVLERFWDWMSGLPTGDLGTSAHGQPVTGLLTTAFPNTLVLSGTALLLTAVLSVTLASWAALRPEGLLDRTVTSLSTAVFAVPEFVVAVALVLVLSLWTGWLPAVTLTDSDGTPASWTMLILPTLALTVPQTGWNTRIARAALADEARAPYVEAAVLDGLPPGRVLLRHVLPGALPTIATGIATSSGVLLGGAVAVETVFNYPGIGVVLSSAVADRDTPVIAGVTALAGAAITVVLLGADLVRDRLTAGGR